MADFMAIPNPDAGHRCNTCRAIFSSVEKVKFRHSVLPGEKITIHVEIEKIRLPFYKFKGLVRVQNKVCSTLIFSAAEMSNK